MVILIKRSRDFHFSILKPNKNDIKYRMDFFFCRNVKNYLELPLKSKMFGAHSLRYRLPVLSFCRATRISNPKWQIPLFTEKQRRQSRKPCKERKTESSLICPRELSFLLWCNILPAPFLSQTQYKLSRLWFLHLSTFRYWRLRK